MRGSPGTGGAEAAIQVEPDNHASAAAARRAGSAPGGRAPGGDGVSFERYVRDLRRGDH
ncbi:hypothetical protein [Streptomyces sp. NPDC047046]|uniref:hypothetical protein n=1 Tax=Streptomyces sp. NPDC047046 TaxID=3155378 RepID=UPI0033FA21EB